MVRVWRWPSEDAYTLIQLIGDVRQPIQEAPKLTVLEADEVGHECHAHAHGPGLARITNRCLRAADHRLRRPVLALSWY